MSFFSELSGIGKGAIVVAVVVLLWLGAAKVVGFFPFGVEPELQLTRGMQR